MLVDLENVREVGSNIRLQLTKIRHMLFLHGIGKGREREREREVVIDDREGCRLRTHLRVLETLPLLNGKEQDLEIAWPIPLVPPLRRAMHWAQICKCERK